MLPNPQSCQVHGAVPTFWALRATWWNKPLKILLELHQGVKRTQIRWGGGEWEKSRKKRKNNHIRQNEN